MAQYIDYGIASTGEVEADLGRRLEAVRLSKNINQTQLATEAGVARRTITRLENGQGISLDTLIRAMRALGLSARLEALLPDPGIRPIERVRLKGRERKRARPGKKERLKEWTWADTSNKS